MKRLSSLLATVSIMMASVFLVKGQGLPGQALEKPRKYIQPMENVGYEQDSDRFKGNIWFVYGDRSNVKTSQTPGGAASFKQIEFGEVYVVVDEKEAYIHIAKDPEVDFRGKLSAAAVDYGWIHKKDMLIWEHGLVSNSLGKLYRKAMILNTLESLELSKKKNNFNELQSGKVNFYLDPGRTQASGRSSGLFQIYFIFKEDKVSGSYLLGRSGNFGKGSQSIIAGWVSKDRAITWDQRVALEPNWDAAAVEDRKGKTLEAKIFMDEASALSYKTSGKANNRTLAWDDDPLGERRIGDYRRFPVLGGNLSQGLANVGVMGDINSANFELSAEQFANTTRTLTQGKAERRNFDIVFVLDATASMDPYFPPVRDAIKASVSDILNNPGEKNTYRFGAVVYRDFAEGKYLSEAAGLTSDEKKITAFIDEVLANYEPRNEKDKDVPEAMYYGLQNALRGIGMDKKHTNIVILVGDVGNHVREDKSQVPQDQIIQLLNEYSCNMIAFQAINKTTHPAYEEFVSQNKFIIKKVAEANYNALKDEAKATGIPLKYPLWETDPKNPNIQRLVNGALAGCILSAPQNYQLEASTLKTEIQQLLKDLRESNNMVLTEAENVVSEGEDINVVVSTTPQSNSPYVSSFPAAMLLFLNQQGYSKEELELISAKSYQMFMAGYAPIKQDQLKYDLFTPVLFLSRKEIASLIIDMEKLNISTSAGDLREKMMEAWKELIRAHIGDLSRNEMEKMSIEEISEKVFGLPSTTKFASVKLGDLSDESVVDDFLLNDFLADIKTKIKELDKVFNANNYPYSFRSNDVNYYWIEQNLLP